MVDGARQVEKNVTCRRLVAVYRQSQHNTFNFVFENFITSCLKLHNLKKNCISEVANVRCNPCKIDQKIQEKEITHCRFRVSFKG